MDFGMMVHILVAQTCDLTSAGRKSVTEKPSHTAIGIWEGKIPAFGSPAERRSPESTNRRHRKGSINFKLCFCQRHSDARLHSGMLRIGFYPNLFFRGQI